jgi:hypothetical protein
MKCLLVLATVLVATATPQISPDETAVRTSVIERIYCCFHALSLFLSDHGSIRALNHFQAHQRDV